MLFSLKKCSAKCGSAYTLQGCWRGLQRETLQSLGEQLEAHIRLEERILFPALEESLSEEALGEIFSRLAAYRDQGPKGGSR